MIRGFATIWRAPAVLWLVVLVNAVLQALLVVPNPMPSVSVSFILLTIVSAVILIVAMAVITAAALLATEGKVTVREAMSRALARLGPFALWGIALVVAFMIGLAIYVAPGAIVLILTPFVLLAAMDGERSPLRANFAAIRRHPWRWIVMALVMAAIVALSWALSAVSAFFLGVVLSSFVTWIWFGFLAIWFQCSWASVYRRESPGGGVSDVVEDSTLHRL